MNNYLKVSKKLIKNWKLYKRDFIWRHNPTPYKMMIAEFMLQRTKANQVEPIFKEFLSKYPNVCGLGEARKIGVAKFTRHLGLHKRSDNFIKSAKYIIDKYRGKFPKNRKALLEIPGVGDYVAGAILAVCFNKREYVVDSNIARFINRYYGLNLKGEIRRKKLIIEIAERLFNYQDTRNLLFALLDFTALVCKPVKPDHEKCFLNKTCKFIKQINPW